MVNVLKTGRHVIVKNKGIAKKIKCSLCQSNVREKYDNVYACDWKVDGSGSILSPNTRIEVIIEDSVDVEVTDTPNTPNFKEQQTIVITRYMNRQMIHITITKQQNLYYFFFFMKFTFRNLLRNP